MTAESVAVHPIGAVLGGRDEWREDDWGGVEAIIALDTERFTEDVVTGLAEFSHLEVVFRFDRVDPAEIRTGPRPARGNPDWPPVGVFAHRGPYRPNRIGVSRCRLLGVSGLELRVAGLDALAGTPVLDVKPYLAEFGVREPVAQPTWATELMASYYSSRGRRSPGAPYTTLSAAK